MKESDWIKKIRFKSGLSLDCVGFIDGTVRPICRPSRDQDRVYNGWKCVHALKHQSVMFVDGMIYDLIGPFLGIRHDSKMLR